MEVGAAFWIPHSPVFLAVPMFCPAFALVPYGIASAAAVCFGFPARCAIIAESRRTSLPTNGASADVARIAFWIAKCAILLFIGAAHHRYSSASTITVLDDPEH